MLQVQPADEEGLLENVSRRLRLTGGPVDSVDMQQERLLSHQESQSYYVCM